MTAISSAFRPVAETGYGSARALGAAFDLVAALRPQMRFLGDRDGPIAIGRDAGLGAGFTSSTAPGSALP